MNADFSVQTELSLLGPMTLVADVVSVCKDAVDHKHPVICVPALFVKKAKELTAGSAVKVCTIAGYPFGINVIEAKLAELVLAMVDGADELELAINFTALKNNDWQYLAKEINTILPVIRSKGKIIKILVEANLLTSEELIKCCDIYGAAGVDYISLSTGLDHNLPAVEIIQLVKKHLAGSIGIKLTGVFNSESEMQDYLNAGVNRLAKMIR